MIIKKAELHTHLSTASLMSLIQVFRSSLDDVWTSYISGPAADALIRNIPFSSFATSRTISFCKAMTGGFWSCGIRTEFLNYKKELNRKV